MTHRSLFNCFLCDFFFPGLIPFLLQNTLTLERHWHRQYDRNTNREHACDVITQVRHWANVSVEWINKIWEAGRRITIRSWLSIPILTLEKLFSMITCFNLLMFHLLTSLSSHTNQMTCIQLVQLINYHLQLKSVNRLRSFRFSTISGLQVRVLVIQQKTNKTTFGWIRRRKKKLQTPTECQTK